MTQSTPGLLQVPHMSADEFDIIRTLFAPLAGAGARGLVDDVAVVEARGALVVTTDTIVEGVHFLPADPVATVARKALRVNVSDIVAKGAKPSGAFLNLIWPRTRDAAEIAEFARGLAEDLKYYDLPLLGGDTTSTDGPLVVSVTMFGEPLGPRTPSRSDAAVGEHVWVTGYIGEPYLGLMVLTTEPAVIGAVPGDQTDILARQATHHYRVPQPPAKFAETIAKYASASLDVSDGLIADAEKLAAASGVAIRIDAEAVPLLGGEAFVSRHGDEGLIKLLTGGDDYQALFTAPPERRREITLAAKATGVNVSLIGDVEEGQGVRLVGGGGRVIQVANAGHSHKLGR